MTLFSKPSPATLRRAQPPPATVCAIQRAASDAEVLAAALDYATARRWPVFPCTSRKVPLVEAFAEVATTSIVQLVAWWEKWPWALVAMPTGKPSGFVVLDI